MENSIELITKQDNPLLSNGLTDSLIIKSFLASKKSSSARTYSVGIKQFVNFVSTPLKSITPFQVIEYAESIRTKYKNTTVNNKLAALKSLFTFLLRTGYVEKNPVSVLSLSKTGNKLSQKIVDQEYLISFLNQIPEKQYQLLFKLLYLSSARISEILTLKWENLYRNSITINGKTGERTVRLDAAFLSSLNILRGRSEYVFSSNRGTKLDPANTWRKLKEFAKKLGFKSDFTLHHFRHNSLTHQLENGANIAHLKAVAGHASANTTSIYLALVDAPDTSKFLPSL